MIMVVQLYGNRDIVNSSFYKCIPIYIVEHSILVEVVEHRAVEKTSFSESKTSSYNLENDIDKIKCHV